MKMKNNALTPVVSAVLALLIVASTMTSVLIWGIPYIEQLESTTRQESADRQFTTVSNAIDELVNSFPGNKKVNTMTLDEGELSLNDQVKDRTIIMYSTSDEYNFTVSGFDVDTCFLAGTAVLMADESYKNIEDIVIGDAVVSYDEATDDVIDQPVTHVFYHQAEEMGDYYLTINNQLTVTPNHRFYVDGDWIQAGNLHLGDVLFISSKRSAEVTSIEKIYQQQPTFDLEIEDTHCYFVSISENTSVLVHNSDENVGWQSPDYTTNHYVFYDGQNRYWTDPNDAIDDMNNPTTHYTEWGYSFHGPVLDPWQWTPWLDLELDEPFPCTQLAFHAKDMISLGSDPLARVEIYYSGGWHNVFGGAAGATFTEDVWQNVVFAEQTVSKARIKFYFKNNFDDTRYLRFNEFRFFEQSKNPNAPTSLECEEQTNPLLVYTLTPNFTAICTDPNPNQKLKEAYVQVGTDDVWPTAEKWNSGWINIADFTEGSRCGKIVYAGSTLHWGVTYYWRIQFKDTDNKIGSYSLGNQFTIAPIDTSVDRISPYVTLTPPITITATGDDGLDSVTLWYRHSSNNVSHWSGWIQSSTDNNYPWSWEFSFPNGPRYYEFYSIGKLAGSPDETAPLVADAISRYAEITIETLDATNIYEHAALAHGNLLGGGGVSCKVWFVYDIVKHTSWENYAYTSFDDALTILSGPFSIPLQELEVGTKYYFRAVCQIVQNGFTFQADGEKQFTTLINGIVVLAPKNDWDWKRGTTQTIEWVFEESLEHSRVAISWERDGTSGLIINDLDIENDATREGQGRYQWSIPLSQVLGHYNYRINVSVIHIQDQVFDTSSLFSIVELHEKIDDNVSIYFVDPVDPGNSPFRVEFHHRTTFNGDEIRDGEWFELTMIKGVVNRIELYWLEYGKTYTPPYTLDGALCIDLYFDSELAGSIWIFDSYSLVYENTVTADNELSKMIMSKGGVIHDYPGNRQITQTPTIYATDDVFSMHIIQLVGALSAGGGSGGFKLRLTSQLYASSIREKVDVYNLSFQFYGDYAEVWREYFKTHYDFHEMVGAEATSLWYEPSLTKTWFAFAQSSIIFNLD